MSKHQVISVDQINNTIKFLRKDWDDLYEKPRFIWGEKEFIFSYVISKKHEKYIINDLLNKTNLNTAELKNYLVKIKKEYSAFTSRLMSGESFAYSNTEANIKLATIQLIRKLLSSI